VRAVVNNNSQEELLHEKTHCIQDYASADSDISADNDCKHEDYEYIAGVKGGISAAHRVGCGGRFYHKYSKRGS
jgi:hypothetical protein